MIIVFVGPPGSGKGTQCELLAEHLGVTHLSTGELFRVQMESGSELGQIAASFIDHGNLVPDHVTIDIVKESLGEAQFNVGCLLDGFPRSVPQAQALDAILAENNCQVDLVLALDVNQDVLVDRMLARKRKDDTLETIQQRFDAYEHLTRPLLNYYQNRDVLVTVDGNGNIDRVFEGIREAVGIVRSNNSNA